ncbi:MAG: adenylate/guanylate cyclase domain-containing protein, partial [Ardenticatenales bacterium]|nr:adenylate/guanylate cyclase domain-containing protein [Ardenticatenales bacterium]
MAALLETFASFIPGVILRHLEADPRPISEPVSYGFPAAVLFADISGFTHLAERFAERGPVGVEDLSRLLNQYFGQLIDLIGAHGGDVVKFAGDGLLALWPAIGEPLDTAALRAAQCGLAIQETLHNYLAAEGVRLSMRVGIGAGEVSVVHLGGVYQRWEPLVVGEPLAQVSRAEQAALPGEVLLSPEAWQLVRVNCIGTPLHTLREHNGKGLPVDEVRLESVRLPIALRSASPLARLSRIEESSIRAYIPGAILYRLLAGQSGWLAELRRLTILFVNLPTLTHHTRLEQAQTVIRALQGSLYRYEGSINKLSVD